MPTYEEVSQQSTEEYFKGNQFSVDAFNRKYTVREGETYVQALKRVCDAIASVEESPEQAKYWSERWFNEIYEGWWKPGGSIMQGAGNPRAISLMNCTTLSLGYRRPEDEEWDNLESIVRNTEYSVAKCAAARQGLGIDFSRLRPKGTDIYNSANESTGAVHWMKKVDQWGYFVGQKGRIPAMLFSLNCKHPDIEEFITAKADYGMIQNANVSVGCNDALYEAARKDKDWDLEFSIPETVQGQRIYMDVHSVLVDAQWDEDRKCHYVLAKHSRPAQTFKKTVKARELMKLIAQYMAKHAEPGIQNMDIAIKYSNSDYLYDPSHPYDPRIISTNAPLVGSTIIPTNFGLIPISMADTLLQPVQVLVDSTVIEPVSALRQTKNVYSQAHRKTVGFMVPASFKKFPNQKVWEIETTSGLVLQCNAEHKWLTDRGMVQTSELTLADSILATTKGLVQAMGMEVDQTHELFKLGQLLGYLVGDGFFVKRANKHPYVGLVWTKADSHYYDLFKEYYQLVTGQPLNYVRERGNGLFETRTSSKKFIDWLSQFLVGDKHQVPQLCYTKLDAAAGFLNGLFQADGHVGKTSLTLTSVSSNLLKGVQQLLLNWFGITGRIRFTESKGVQYQTQDGPKVSKAKRRGDLIISVLAHQKVFQQSIGLGSKGYLLTELCNRQSSRDHSNRSFHQLQKITETDEIQDMYCAVVPGVHAFVANGVLSSNCSEQYLSRDSLCVLASINCGMFSTDSGTLREQLMELGASVNRFLDNVNTYELVHQKYATPHQEMAIRALRRTGAGFTNMAAWLLKKNVGYASPKAAKLAGEFMQLYNYALYSSSIQLGHEKGSFEMFDKDKYCQSPFIQRMMALGLEFDAMRNVTVSSIAPVGTLSLMFPESVLSYGIEPPFGPYWWKRTRISGEYQYYFCVPTVLRELLAKQGVDLGIEADTLRDTWDGQVGKPVAAIIDKALIDLGIQFHQATDVDPMVKLDLMAEVMKWVDSSISTTYMLKSDASVDDVYDFIMEAHKREVKSIAAFPQSKMYGIVSYVPFKELALSLRAEGVTMHPQNFSEEELKELHLVAGEIARHDAPKRPEVLPCDIHHVFVQNDRWVVMIGKLGDQPYEIFGGLASKVQIPKKVTQGWVVKRKIEKPDNGRTSCYDLFFGDDDDPMIIRDVSVTFDNPDYALITRLISMNLRHGNPIEHLIAQLNKDCRSTIVSFNKVISRILKKYQKFDVEGVMIDGDPTCISGNCE